MPKLINQQGQLVADVHIASHQLLSLTGEHPELLTKSSLADVKRIDIAFAHFTDGRGYSVAKLIRERYRFEGELRAIGDVTVDQLSYLNSCGFTSFALRDDQGLSVAPAALKAFGGRYQSNYSPVGESI